LQTLDAEFLLNARQTGCHFPLFPSLKTACIGRSGTQSSRAGLESFMKALGRLQGCTSFPLPIGCI
jgi:hypothetical protein